MNNQKPNDKPPAGLERQWQKWRQQWLRLHFSQEKSKVSENKDKRSAIEQKVEEYTDLLKEADEILLAALLATPTQKWEWSEKYSAWQKKMVRLVLHDTLHGVSEAGNEQ